MTASQPRRVLVLGASGLVGGHCLDALLENPAFAEVRILVRRTLGRQHPKLKEVLFQHDWSGHASVFAVDTVLCCLGSTIKKAGSRAAFRQVDFDLCLTAGEMAKVAGVETFAVISAVNANPRALSFYARVKGEMEAALRALGLPHLVIARPSLLLGERKEMRLLEEIGQQLSKPIVGWFAKAGLDATPIAAEDVARALVAAVLLPSGQSVQILCYGDLMRLSKQFLSLSY